jgi:hypothetical protein
MNENVLEKINNLEKRVAALEKIEHRRKVKNIIIMCMYGLFVVIVIAGGIYMYSKLKPYKDKLDSLNNVFGSSETSNINLNDYSDLLNDLFK